MTYFITYKCCGKSYTKWTDNIEDATQIVNMIEKSPECKLVDVVKE